MRRAAIGLALTLSACPRSDPPAPAHPASVVSVAPPTSGAPQASKPEAGADEAVLIGTVHRLGTKICKSIDKADWEDVHLRAGLVRLEGSTEGLESQRERGVILFGTVLKRGKPELPRDPGTCMPIQRRSDWIDSPDGTILRRDDGPDIALFRVRTSKRLDGLAAHREGDQVLVEFENPLDAPLEAVEVIAHYEGCYGKPLTHHERREVGSMLPKAKRQSSVPVLAMKSIGSRGDVAHRASSIQIRARAPEVYFDLDVQLAKLGVEAACPNR